MLWRSALKQHSVKHGTVTFLVQATRALLRGLDSIWVVASTQSRRQSAAPRDVQTFAGIKRHCNRHVSYSTAMLSTGSGCAGPFPDLLQHQVLPAVPE